MQLKKDQLVYHAKLQAYLDVRSPAPDRSGRILCEVLWSRKPVKFSHISDAILKVVRVKPRELTLIGNNVKPRHENVIYLNRLPDNDRLTANLENATKELAEARRVIKELRRCALEIRSRGLVARILNRGW